MLPVILHMTAVMSHGCTHRHDIFSWHKTIIIAWQLYSNSKIIARVLPLKWSHISKNIMKVENQLEICNLSLEVQAKFNTGECHMDTTERSTIIDVLWLYLQSVRRRKTLASRTLPAHYRLSEPHMLYLTAEVERSPRHMVALDEVFSSISSCFLLPFHFMNLLIQLFLWKDGSVVTNSTHYLA